MKLNQISEEIKTLEEKWIAVDEGGNVIESAEDLETLRKEISQLSKRVFILKVPKLDTNFVPAS